MLVFRPLLEPPGAFIIEQYPYVESSDVEVWATELPEPAGSVYLWGVRSRRAPRTLSKK
jgi:hypothetical protein